MEIIKRRKLKIRLVKYAFLFSGIFIIVAILYKNIDVGQSVKSYESSTTPNIERLKKSSAKHSISISQSMFQGLAKDLSPYKIIAKQVNKIDDINFNLQSINGDYLIDNNKLNIIANSGTYNNDTSDITLNGDISIFYEGITFNTERLSIETNTKEAFTDEEVIVNYKNSQIKSDSFETQNNSDIIKFKGNVQSSFNVDDFQ